MLYVRLRAASTSLTAVSAALRELGSTLVHPSVLLMELRSRCKKAASYVTKCVAQLLVGRIVSVYVLCQSNPVPLRQGDKPHPTKVTPGLTWHDSTLSISWWFLLLLFLLVMIAAGSHAAKR